MTSTTERPLTERMHPDGSYLDVRAYEQAGGYQAIRKVLSGGMTPQAVTAEVKDANLRGRGGAGFSTGLKWSFVPLGKDAPSPTYLCVNADEMEPGTFKDRLLMERDPHQLIEGAIVAGFAIEADIAYIFLRGEYTLAAERLSRAIAEAYERNYLGKNILGSGYSLELYLHLSGGRYICGDETGLLNALEGKRANPRAKPPFPPVAGLFGKPTIVNNVETISCVPHIINNGAAWFRGLGRTKDAGTKLYGVSGKVKRPGLWELPMGTTVREILEEHAGGMRDGLHFRGLLPGGSSTPFVVEEHLDTPMDFTEMPARYGHDDCARRPDLPSWHGLEHDALFRAGILRLVHALLERPGMGGAASAIT
jgi:NADH-quinone oxidoreductase subunit F